MYRSLAFALFAALLWSSCKHQPPNAPHATVVLRDGSQVSGTVTATSTSELSLNLDNNGGARNIPMSQVSSINYDQPAAPAPSQTAAAPAQTPPPAQPPPPMQPPAGGDDNDHPALAAIQSRTLEIPAGTRVRVRTEETIDSRRAAPGQTYAARVASEVRDAAGAVVIPRGANAQLFIKSASRGGRFRGASDLVLDLQSVAVEGQRYIVDSSAVVERGRRGLGRNKRTGEFVGGGAALGAIIGAIAGHGTGAALGAVSGAGAGAITEVVTKGSIRVPAESVLTFRLEAPLRIVAAQ